MHVDTVFVWVGDLERSMPFYRDVLGLEPGPRFGSWQAMATEGARFALHEGDAPDGQRQRAVVGFAVADLEGEVARIRAAGHQPIAPPADTGVSRFVTYEDPDGTHIQLIERYGEI